MPALARSPEAGRKFHEDCQGGHGASDPGGIPAEGATPAGSPVLLGRPDAGPDRPSVFKSSGAAQAADPRQDYREIINHSARHSLCLPATDRFINGGDFGVAETGVGERAKVVIDLRKAAGTDQNSGDGGLPQDPGKGHLGE